MRRFIDQGWKGSAMLAIPRSGLACAAAIGAAVALALPAAASADFSLTIEAEGSGTGVVKCAVGLGPVEACDTEYAEGTELTLVPEPGINSEFIEFSGDCGPLACELTMDSDHTAVVTFDLEPGAVTYPLSVAKSGTGSGTVQCEVEGGPIGSCSTEYPDGTEVVVLAEAHLESSFAGFSGACTGSSCELTINAAKSVTATFDLEAVSEFALDLTVVGVGTVLCEAQEGIESCQAKYPEGTEVTLLPTAGFGSEFAGFSGACTGSSCELTMDAAKSVTATFSVIATPEFSLAVTPAGTGTGTVKCEINAGPEEACAASYPNGTSVKLKATASPGSEFTTFSAGTGSATACSASPCAFTISANSSVTATFNLIPRTLTITPAGTGTGTVKCEINAGPEEACAASYPNGTSVKLKATASPGSEFTTFSAGTGSATACSASPCAFTISANSSVTATFNLITVKPKFALKVKKTGTGTGKVTSSPTGIDCGSDCTESYEEDTIVTLSKAANPGSVFAKWTGACTGLGTCKVTMSEAKEVTAEFHLVAKKFALAIEKIGTGTGKVTSSPTGIDCGSDCEETFTEGTEVTLTAAAEEGSAFDHWTGSGCSKGICVVTMSKARTIKAVFDAVGERTLTVSKAGSGTGTITSAPKGIDCGATCSVGFGVGKKVTLTAAAATGSTFTGFSGACTGTGACKVTMSEARGVTATFEVNPSTLPQSSSHVGLAVVAGTAKVRNGKALVRVLCNGPSACKGELRLGLRVPGSAAGRQSKRIVVIGKGRFDLQPGASAVLRVKLSRRALTQLEGRTALGARVAGTGIHAHALRLKNV